jgi:hypothetical protein
VKQPAGIHLMLNLTHEPVVAKYLDDLEASISEAGGKAGDSSVAVY